MTDNPFTGMEAPGGVNYGEFTFRTKSYVLARLAECALPAVTGSAAVPVLACFRLRVADGHLELAATDMERTVLAVSPVVSVEGVAEAEVKTAFLPARKLVAILKEVPEGDVTVAVKKDQATVTCGPSWVLRLPDDGDYPELVEPTQLAFHLYDREKLLAGLKAVRHVVSKDGGRPNLTQVDIKTKDSDEGLWGHVTASDGTRFARSVLDGFPCDLTIPASALGDLTRLLAASQADAIGVSLTEDDETGRSLVFQVGSVVLSVKARSTPFPDMDRLLLDPTLENDQVLSVDKDELTTAVRRVRINADGESAAIALELGEGSVKVIARDKTGNSASEGIIADWKGSGRVLCVNHVFLSEMLAAHPDKTCQFRLGADHGKRRSNVLLIGDGITQVIAQMVPTLVGY